MTRPNASAATAVSGSAAVASATSRDSPAGPRAPEITARTLTVAAMKPATKADVHVSAAVTVASDAIAAGNETDASADAARISPEALRSRPSAIDAAAGAANATGTKR